MLCFARIIWNPLLAADDSHKRLGWFAQLCEIDLRESSGKRFLNRSYPGTPFRCRESRPYHEEPRLKTSFYPFLPALAALFLQLVTNGHVHLVTGSESSTYCSSAALWKKKKKYKNTRSFNLMLSELKSSDVTCKAGLFWITGAIMAGWFGLVYCCFNGTFSTNTLYRAIEVQCISRRAGEQCNHIIEQWSSRINQENLQTLWPGLSGDDPLATVRLPQRSLSSQSLGKYWNLTKSTKRHIPTKTNNI